MTKLLTLSLASLLALAPRGALAAQPPADGGAVEPEEDDPWAQYEDEDELTSSTTPPAQPAAPAPTAVAPAETPPPDRPRRPSGGVGLMAAGPVLIVAAVPFALWGNQVFRRGCLNDDATTIGDELAEGFGCGLSATGSFLLHGVAFLLYAGGAAMVGGGALKKGRSDAWDDAFQTRQARNTLGLKAGGGALLGISVAGLIGSRVGLWVTLDNCDGVACVQARQRLATGVSALSVMGIAAGAGMLAYGVAYDRRLRRWAPELAIFPTFGPRQAGLSFVGRF